MEHGGKRDRAGRKTGSANLLNQELRETIKAEQIIKFLQDLALGKIEGATLSERKEASIALLKKILPDCKQTDLKMEQTQILIIDDDDD